MPPISTFVELLDHYRRGERNFAASDLDGDDNNDLAGQYLDGIDLSESFIVASFRGCSLRGANFCRANLKTCDFQNSDLTSADFRGAALCATSFDNAQKQDSKFEGAYYHGRILKPGELPDW